MTVDARLDVTRKWVVCGSCRWRLAERLLWLDGRYFPVFAPAWRLDDSGTAYRGPEPRQGRFRAINGNWRKTAMSFRLVTPVRCDRCGTINRLGPDLDVHEMPPAAT